MSRRRAWLWGGVVGVVAVVAARNFPGLRRGSSSEWPAIDDPAALRRAAGAVCRGEGGWRELQPAEYPAAVTKLRPACVYVSGERLYVGLVPAVGGARFHGYDVWPDTARRPDGGIVREQSDERDPRP